MLLAFLLGMAGSLPFLFLGQVWAYTVVGVAPEATIVGLKACTIAGFCFADSVAAALRYAGDMRLDIVNLSLFADPFLYLCASEAEQRAILKDPKDAARYAQQRGVVIVAAAGNEADDLGHPTTDEISPDWPPDSGRFSRRCARSAASGPPFPLDPHRIARSIAGPATRSGAQGRCAKSCRRQSQPQTKATSGWLLFFRFRGNLRCKRPENMMI